MPYIFRLAILLVLVPTVSAQESLWLEVLQGRSATHLNRFAVEGGFQDLLGFPARQYRVRAGAQRSVADFTGMTISLGASLSIARWSYVDVYTTPTGSRFDSTQTSGIQPQNVTLIGAIRGDRVAGRLGFVYDLGPENIFAVSDGFNALFGGIGYGVETEWFAVSGSVDIVRTLANQRFFDPFTEDSVAFRGNSMVNVTVAPAGRVGPFMAGNATHFFWMSRDFENDWQFSITPFVSFGLPEDRIQLHARMGAVYEYVDRGLTVKAPEGTLRFRPKVSLTVGATVNL